MKKNAEKYPCQIIVSKDGKIEFPADWTHNPAHLNVALIHDFTSVEALQSEAEMTALESKNCDWISDSPSHLLIFKDEAVFDRFKDIIPNHICKARLATEQDLAEFGI